MRAIITIDNWAHGIQSVSFHVKLEYEALMDYLRTMIINGVEVSITYED